MAKISTNLTPSEQRIVEEAWAKQNPSIFLNYFLKSPDGGFYVYPGSVRHTQYMKHWLAADKPALFEAKTSEILFEVAPRFGDFSEHAKGAPADTVTSVAFFEKRGYILLPWALDEFRTPQTRRTVIGTPGTGKAQPLTSKILTPSGWKLMGEMRVGDGVVGEDGKSHQVLGVYPQGIRPIYQVTFTDGSVVEADAEHLWKARLGNTWVITKTLDLTGEHWVPCLAESPKQVVSVAYARDDEAQCILIDSPSHLYVTDGYIVTHNTLNRGFIGALFKCATTPYYKFLNVAPTVYQSNIMIQELRVRVIGTLFEQKFLLPGTKGYHTKPYAKYSYLNEATAEFMNVARNADNIQGWRGDEINFDEAGLANGDNEVGGVELADMLPGIVSRMTGVRPDGKPRTGLLGLISMAYDNDALWQLYDYGFLPETSNQYFSMLITKEANPYITPRQWRDIVNDVERNVAPGMQRSWLYGDRPTKVGAEFPAPLIDGMFSEEQMTLARTDDDTVIEESKHGIWNYQEPYRPNHNYIMAGDPGLGEPPFRNAPCIQVWDVTNFPEERSKLTGFWWGYSNGSIVPFLTQFNKWASVFRVPNNCRAFDSTGTQSHMTELAWQAGEDAVVPLGFEGSKKWQYLNSAKILMSKGLIQAPKGISGLESQLRHYRLPDKRLAQDTVSTLCMASFLMFPLYRDAYPEEPDEKETVEASRLLAASSGRLARPGGDRYGGHRR